ncbi:hypothetical protein CGLO_06831 [Colletotrichum gloeosporioides Cg-14]|uniref:Uncharacterized protein n=1 Tax=Colletotrichum gloeosporioides (strain Cg-14) TaxID=1237896 RepID=T0KDH3_COLGC|nr:hypothetical protein CGLO_06831 [Colletotrichum gloeosporioides Cg-14]
MSLGNAFVICFYIHLMIKRTIR